MFNNLFCGFDWENNWIWILIIVGVLLFTTGTFGEGFCMGAFFEENWVIIVGLLILLLLWE